MAQALRKAVIYVRTEYPLAIKHLVIALRQAHGLGLLGENILGTGFSFDIQIVKGAGAFVCGEETALIRSVEGERGEPRQRPPYPIERGIGGSPRPSTTSRPGRTSRSLSTKVRRASSKVGSPQNTGTKIFSLVGKVRNTGLVEVPMGITIGEIVYGVGRRAIRKGEDQSRADGRAEWGLPSRLTVRPAG